MEIREALAWAKEVILFSAGSNGSSHAPFAFSRHFPIPLVSEPGCLEALQAIVAGERITHILPAHDDALLALAEWAPLLSARVVTSPLETCRTTRSKSATLAVAGSVIPVPRVFAHASEIDQFPVFLKPDRGQGSQRTSLASSQAHLTALLSEDPDRIVVEYLPGSEFTVDCFSDRDRGLLYSRGRQRTRIRAGIAMASCFVDNPCFAEYAKRLSGVFDLHGAWFFQVKADRDGILRLLEVAPRIGGASSLSRVAGVNLPLLSLYESERIPVVPMPLDLQVQLDRALKNRYSTRLSFSRVYVDLDDTLVVHGRVHGGMIRFLHQCIDTGKRLVLLTRHEGDLGSFLAEHRLQSLFDEVHLVPSHLSKADFMTPGGAIFIDDSFRERQDVAVRHQIPVFDASMVDVLLDDRV